MAKNMCYAAQQVLHDRDREGRGVLACPVAMTSKQEREAQGGNTTYWCKSGKDLWKLKSQQPHLFARQNLNSQANAPKRNLPAGFEESASSGWLYNAERRIFMEAATRRMLWIDQNSGLYQELHQGQDHSGTLTLSGGAAASNAKATSGNQARHVVIMDLHKAAEAFKIDLGHIDRPAAMLAVYGRAAGTVPAEVGAKVLHERILKRLGGFRSSWSDEALKAALVECFTSISADSDSEKGVAAAVVLLFGAKLVAASAHGAACAVAEPRTEGPGAVPTFVRSEGAAVNTACVHLHNRSAPCVLLFTEPIEDEPLQAALLQAAKGRPRAGAVALLHAQRSRGIGNSPKAAACARLAWGPDAEDGPAPKRQKVEASSETKVRCRQILLKYVGCKQPVDRVRRRPVCRSLAEAEAILLDALVEIDAGGDAAFAQKCRAVSECSSSLKGGDLVGDVGWLAKPQEKPGEKPTREMASRYSVIRAALKLEVGELSDILVSDDGVHILQRRA